MSLPRLPASLRDAYPTPLVQAWERTDRSAGEDRHRALLELAETLLRYLTVQLYAVYRTEQRPVPEVESLLAAPGPRSTERWVELLRGLLAAQRRSPLFLRPGRAVAPRPDDPLRPLLRPVAADRRGRRRRLYRGAAGQAAAPAGSGSGSVRRERSTARLAGDRRAGLPGGQCRLPRPPRPAWPRGRDAARRRAGRELAGAAEPRARPPGADLLLLGPADLRRAGATVGGSRRRAAGAARPGRALALRRRAGLGDRRAERPAAAPRSTAERAGDPAASRPISPGRDGLTHPELALGQDARARTGAEHAGPTLVAVAAARVVARGRSRIRFSAQIQGVGAHVAARRRGTGHRGPCTPARG